MTRLKLAELTSGVGQAENPVWVVALYWVYWLFLAAVLAMLFHWRRS